MGQKNKLPQTNECKKQQIFTSPENLTRTLFVMFVTFKRSADKIPWMMEGEEGGKKVFKVIKLLSSPEHFKQLCILIQKFLKLLRTLEKSFNVYQCSVLVSPGTWEQDPWEKIHQNRSWNRQKIWVLSRTGTGNAKVSGSVLHLFISYYLWSTESGQDGARRWQERLLSSASVPLIFWLIALEFQQCLFVQ